MSSTVDKMYKTFNVLCGPRLTYTNGVDTCKAGDILYAFSYTVSGFARSLRIGPIVELSVVEIQTGFHKYKAAFRRKKDYSLFKKPCHMYRYNMYRTKEDAEAEKLISDAKLLEELGCFSLVMEKIPADLAAKATASVNIPTIGIGAGAGCDGQVLVVHDMLGLNNEFKPKFVRKYLNLEDQIHQAIGQYVADVKSGDFPNVNEQY